MPTTEELAAQIDLLTQTISQLDARATDMERQTRIRDAQLNESTRRALDHANKIQELRINTGIDVPNVAATPPPPA